MISQNLLIKNIKNDLSHQIKSEMMAANYMDTSEMSSHTEAPIDLSRRCDSVETRKTPSPYNSSAFGESSPSLLNESPSSMSRSANFAATLNHNRSETPTNRYQAEAYIQRNFSSHEQTRFPFESDRTPSPPETTMHPLHHHYMREQLMAATEDEINPYILQALQQKLQGIPATVSANGQLSPDALQYPMVLGRDGKMARPFKAYPRDPLSISAAIPATDSITDLRSSERFISFRQQMLEQIHAANGGRPTVTNPKMRRTSTKNYSDTETNQSELDYQLQQQHKQNIEAQNQANSQSDSSSSGPMNGKESVKDNAYFERRRKNNAATKKSRYRRRIKEDEIAIRAAFLERENFELKIELATAKRQLAKFLEK